MGAEAPCKLVLEGADGGKAIAGKALLESEELLFVPAAKGSRRLVIRLASVSKVSAHGGVLTIEWGRERAAFELGAVAPKWLEKIKNPKSRADKLGIKAGHRVAILGGKDEGFVAELAGRGAVTNGRSELDFLFYWVSTRADVAREKLSALTKKIKKNGAIWVIRPKGSADVTERDVYTAARDAGLVDVKVVAFSATHTAEKMVIPVEHR
jgi:hypothetical protein